MHNKCLHIAFASLICFAFGSDLQPGFQKCKRGDNDCLTAAIQDALPKMQKGLPEFKARPFQPLEIPSLTIDAGEGPVNVVQNYKNVKIYDIVLANIEKANMKFNDKNFNLNIYGVVPNIKMEADYDFNGKMLMLPMVGKGHVTITGENCKFSLELRGEVIRKNGDEFVEIRNTTIKFTPYHIAFTFDNLFDGDERLGSEVNKILNDNWKGVWEDVGSGYEEAIAIIIQDVVNNIFTKIPSKDLFPV